jgi:glycosyltransferase involved in cell wall biosynthesis
MSPPPAIRVAFVNHTAELGGGEIALLELIRHLNTARIQPLVILFAEGPLVPLLREVAEVHILSLSPTVLKAKKDGLGLHSLLSGGPALAGLAFLYRLYRLLRSLQPQIVYTNSLKADLLGGVAGRLAGVPVIWHVRDRIAPDYLPGKVVSLVRLLARLIPRYIVANSASTLSTLNLAKEPALKSRFEEAGLMKPRFEGAGLQPRRQGPDKHGGFSPGGNACVIHDGVDPAKYAAPPSREATTPLTVGLIGRISPWKGQDVFLDAIRLLREAHPAAYSAARFEIIGVATFGEVDFERRIRQLHQAHDLTDSVHFTGFEPDIPQRLTRLDIVVHASTIPEPFGQVIIEGMAAGLPVIATNGGGVPEIVLDGITGILVPMRDPQAMANAMARLLAEADLRKTMGQAARAHLLHSFPIWRTAKAVENVCEQLLRSSHAIFHGRHRAL